MIKLFLTSLLFLLSTQSFASETIKCESLFFMEGTRMGKNTLNFLSQVDTTVEANRLVRVDLVNPSLVVDFNNSHTQPKIRAAVFEIDRKAFVSKNFKNETSLELKYLTGEIAITAINESTDESFPVRMSFLSDDQKKRNLDDLIGKVNESKNVGFYSESNELLGFIQMRTTPFQGETPTLISWVWIRSGVTQDIRASIHSSIQSLIAQADQPKIIASVHTDNVPSFNFFSRLGFKVKWVYVL